MVIERKQSFLHSINKDKEFANKAINANTINGKSINAKQRSHKRKIVANDGQLAMRRSSDESRPMGVLTFLTRKNIDLLENVEQWLDICYCKISA